MSAKQEEAKASWGAAVGKPLSWVTNLFSLIRDTLAEMEIGFEIVSWLVSDEGRPTFVEKFLKPLGQTYLATQRVRIVDKTVMLVNLDAPPLLPFKGAEVDTKPKTSEGWVRIEKRKDGLYMSDRKVVLHLSEQQKDGRIIRGHELRDELSGKPVLHPNILDALIDNPHMIPAEWKGQAIFFWAVIYRGPDGSLCVRYADFRGGAWVRDDDFLGSGFSAGDPAAVLASS